MSNSERPLFLSEEALERLCVTTVEAVSSIEKMIRGQAEGTVWSAPKSTLLPPDGRYMMTTLAAADDPPLLVVKSLVLNPKNSERDLPQINGLITVLDSNTGLPKAVLDANWITATRTAALSAVAAQRLARDDSRIAAFVGTGVQASSHLDAFADLYPLEEIRVFGRGRTNIEKLCRQAEAKGIKATIADTGQEAIADADLIVSSVTLSLTSEPFLSAKGTKKGCFAAITDIGTPWHKDSFTAFDCIVIDDVEQEASMRNKLAPPELIAGDLSSLVLEETPGRTSATERTAFMFRGHSLGDLALAALVYQKAVASN
ncbi:MAG: ornithine cyclodeaminase family protein [Limibacillus sp.]|jgi:ornithine cyclodeaminase/alanine dehydrogenase-like protein (mu-crystallin family)